MKIGCVEYINALPLHLPFRLKQIPSPAEFVYAIPQKLNVMLQEKQLDAALSSSVEYLEGNHSLLPGFGIVGRHQVLSVNLYTRVPVNQLNGVRIGITHHSATSVSLLKVLCHHVWKVKPSWEPLNRSEPLSNYDAFLLIGDEALKDIPGYQTIDLAAAWYQLTALPFVFALFSVRKEVPEEAIKKLQTAFEQALEWSEAHPQEIEKAALQQCQIPLSLLQKYYSVLGYRVGKKEMESVEIFRKLRKDVH